MWYTWTEGGGGRGILGQRGAVTCILGQRGALWTWYTLDRGVAVGTCNTWTEVGAVELV
ncbi:unnamed protein product [Staurois parvus]|uniref:Uncharacterized protein n=1 Tax=Staurois parvus TaxID=386267 RepID=A0ABN9H1X8_9NEOB|nr:unnamed protein product [Staurois parvus]